MTRWLWFLKELLGRLWVKASLYGVAAVLTALASIYFRRFIPEDISRSIGADAVDSILHILASSMLAVTIFSVSTMVAAYNIATSHVTPRAAKLLVQDRYSHKALSTFIGTFIFSLVGIVSLQAGIYGESGRLILFVVTIGVIILIVVTLIRWIEYLTNLGQISETIKRVEDATVEALKERFHKPCLGGQPLPAGKEIPKNGVAVYPDKVGYVQNIDMNALNEIGEKGKIYLTVLPGEFVGPSEKIAIASGVNTPEMRKKIGDAFIIKKERSFEQDPRYGLSVLSEIASRALSPGINDAGTAIHVISAGIRILTLWGEKNPRPKKKNGNCYKNIYAPELPVSDLFQDFFHPIARDGASKVEVAVKLQKAFQVLFLTGNKELQEAALRYSAISLKHSLPALSLSEDREQVKTLALAGQDS